MTVRGGGVPACVMAFVPRKRMGSAASELRCRCAWLHHGSGPWTHRIQGCGAIDPRDRKRAPLRSSSQPYRVCRRARSCQGMAWQGPEYVERLVRRPTLTAPARAGFAILRGRGEETGFPGRTKKPMKKEKKKRSFSNPLDVNQYKAQAEKPRGRKYRCTGEGRTASQ